MRPDGCQSALNPAYLGIFVAKPCSEQDAYLTRVASASANPGWSSSTGLRSMPGRLATPHVTVAPAGVISLQNILGFVVRTPLRIDNSLAAGRNSLRVMLASTVKDAPQGP